MSLCRPRAVLYPLTIAAAIVLLPLAARPAAYGFQVPQEPSRFEALEIPDPSQQVNPQIVPLGGGGAAAGTTAAGWGAFRALHGEAWDIYLDARSGAPLLVQGQGIPWVPGSGISPAGAGGPTVRSLAESLRAFAASNRSLLMADDTELVINEAASGPLTEDLWQIQFGRIVSGIPVAGDGYVFYIGHGNLMAFGASRWSVISSSPVASMTSEEARDRLYAYMGISPFEPIDLIEPGSLLFLPLAAPGSSLDSYGGPVGAGYDTALAYRIVLRLQGERQTWVGLVDARSGKILALYDDNKYWQLRGGVYPVSNDGACPDGCEQPNYPMPYADFLINGGNRSFANGMGVFACSPSGALAQTFLNGKYVRINDTCGTTYEAVGCENDLDLRSSSGTDCAVPSAGSPGNTHSARSGFYHLNRIMEHARAWLPANSWLNDVLTDNANINDSCNAYWDGATVNFFHSSGSCRNTGEIAGVFLHEWGHGFDANDGGGYDNPSEAYADITAFLQTHVSCMGRGFFKGGNCGGYGNRCLSCSGVRDQDWAQRANHTPSTPEGFIAMCPGGSGPCGKEVHCESYLTGETLWDLAVRDLPASGLDENTAWQLVDRLWYKSRAGSGGNIYSCGLPATNRSCAANSWFTKLRLIDDDDGNLANGTPHAGAIFAAFNRHNIPCGFVTDSSNQSTSSCPSIAAPSLTATAESEQVPLSWTAVAGASSYRVLRNDTSCSSGYTVIATVPGTTYTDTGLANEFTEYYSVQAVGANSACEGALSNCRAVTPVAAPTAADISLTNTSSPSPVVAGNNLTYTVTLSNAGPDAAARPRVSTSIPANTTFQSLSAPLQWMCTAPSIGTGGAVSCETSTQAAGSSSIISIEVKVNQCAGNGTVLSDTASATSNSADGSPANNSATATATASDDGTCNDGSVCTRTDFCQNGSCVGTDPIVCTALDACHAVGICNPTTGVCPNPPKPNGALCDDGNPCTGTDVCWNGSCTGTNPTWCGALDQCHQGGLCDTATGECTNPLRPDGSTCDDGTPCTHGDSCHAGICAGAAGPPTEVNETVLVHRAGGTAEIAWTDFPGEFNVYRGSVAAGTPWAYNQTCLASRVLSPATDNAPLAPGGLFYYVVTRTYDCGESVPGRDSAGNPEPNPNPCQ